MTTRPTTAALLKYFLCLVIAAVALAVAWPFKVPEPVLIAVGAAAGLIIFLPTIGA